MAGSEDQYEKKKEIDKQKAEDERLAKIQADIEENERIRKEKEAELKKQQDELERQKKAFEE